MRILVIEDAEDLADAVVDSLRSLGYAVDWAADGHQADELLRTETYQLIILDVMLPGPDGQTLLRQLRRRGNRTPVLVTTARSQIDTKIHLLDLGADDYIVKPFDLRELEARCRALLRRSHGMASSETVIGNLAFDTARRTVSIDGRPIDLSAREFRLLELFLGNMGRVMTRTALIEQLFDLEQAVTPNAVEMSVSRLRRKLEGASVVIRTMHGVGYVSELQNAE